jgi:hypothetical protein
MTSESSVGVAARATPSRVSRVTVRAKILRRAGSAALAIAVVPMAMAAVVSPTNPKMALSIARSPETAKKPSPGPGPWHACWSGSLRAV